MGSPYRDAPPPRAPVIVEAPSALTRSTIGLGSALFFLALTLVTTLSESWTTTTCERGRCVVRRRSLIGDTVRPVEVGPRARVRLVRRMVQPGGKRSTVQNPAVPRWTPELTTGDASTVFFGAPPFPDEAAANRYVDEQNAAIAEQGSLVLVPDRRPRWIVPVAIGELVALLLCAVALGRSVRRDRISVWRDGDEVVVAERSRSGASTWRFPLRDGALYRVCGEGETAELASAPELAMLSMPLRVVRSEGEDGRADTVIPLRVRRVQLVLDVVHALESLHREE